MNKQTVRLAGRRVVLVLIALLNLLVLASCDKDEAGNKPGDVISFGNYDGQEIDWIVLDVSEDSMLVISRECLVRKQFHEFRRDVTWEESSSRKWLNEDFYNEAFDEKEKNRISLTHLVAEDNTKYHISGGKDTDDYLFYLTAKEADKYFKNNAARCALNPDGSKAFWWLRTPGYIDEDFSYVATDGDIIIFGEYCSNYLGGIRPAMYIGR